MLAAWESDQTLAPMQVLNIWACAHLFRMREQLTAIAGREDAIALIEQLDPIAQRIMSSRFKLTGSAAIRALKDAEADVYAIIAPVQERYADEQRQREQEQQERDENSDSDDRADSDTGESESDTSKCQSESSDSAESSEESDEADSDSGKASDSDTGESDSDEADEADDDEGDSDSESSASDTPREGAEATGNERTEYDGPLPSTCPDDSDEAEASDEDQAFWTRVKEEADRIDAESWERHGSVHTDQALRPWLDKPTVAAIRATYTRLASEPSRARRQESGKLDKRRIPFIRERDDIFSTHSDRQLDGTLAIALDLSGSTERVEQLIKRTGASIYAALRPTAIRCWIYSYGDPEVVRLADPKRVVPFDCVESHGGTPTGQAIATIRREVPRVGQSVMINVTDGGADSMSHAQREMQAARAEGWRVINIMVGIGASWAQYYAECSDAIVVLANYGQLAAAMRDIVDQLVKATRGSQSS